MRNVTVEIPRETAKRLLENRFPAARFVEMIMADEAKLKAFLQEEVLNAIRRETGA